MSIVKLLGIPSHAGSRPETCNSLDQHNGPREIRNAISSLTRGYEISLNFDDLGDVPCGSSVASMLSAVEERVSSVFKAGEVPFLLGGSHTFTLAGLRAASKCKGDFSLIYIDAHPDIMPHPEINYGSGLFYAMKEEVLDPRRLALIGVRQTEDEELRIIQEHGLCHISAQECLVTGVTRVLKRIQDSMPGPYYISIDLDAIDPGEAPGVGNPYPGGLTSREVMYLAGELCRSDVIALEVSQLSPLQDRDDATANIAAALVLQLSSVVGGKTRRH